MAADPTASTAPAPGPSSSEPRKRPEPPKGIVLRSLRSPTLRLQIKSGSSEDVPGTRRRRMRKPVYIEFSGYLGRLDSRTWGKAGFESRDEALDGIRNHTHYMDTFVIGGADASAEDKSKTSELFQADPKAEAAGQALVRRLPKNEDY